MIQFGSTVAGGVRATRRLVFSGLKWAAHGNPHLLAGVRALRKVMFSRKPEPPMPPNLLAGFDPLHPDEKMLAAFADVSPALRDEMMAEFVEIARVLRGMDTGAAAGCEFLAHFPIDPQFSTCKELNIVYSPPKVGGSTIAATLQRHFQSRYDHVHFISLKGIAFVERMIRRAPPRPLTVSGWHQNLLRARWFRVVIAINRALRTQHQRVGSAVRKPYLVAGVREPVAMHLSCCFEGWQNYVDTPNLLTADFIHERLADDAWHLVLNNWFSDDLKATFAIDVYSRPFPAERGWEIYENDAARVLLIRQESLASLPDALGALYSCDPSVFSVVTSNTAEGKDYATHYNAVKKALQLSEQELEVIYSTPYVRHFYTPEEIAAFKRRWRATEIIRKVA